MDPMTPKIDFKISPGMSARSAEQEDREFGLPEVRRIQGGDAARMAEAEARASAQRPYNLRMQARSGRSFTLDDLASLTAQSQQSSLYVDDSANGHSEAELDNSSRTPEIHTSSL